MTVQRMKVFLGTCLLGLALSMPFTHDAEAYGYHRFGGVFIGGPYYPYAYPAPYAYAPPPYPYPPPYAYAPPPYPYPPPYAYAPPVAVAPAIGLGVHIR